MSVVNAALVVNPNNVVHYGLKMFTRLGWGGGELTIFNVCVIYWFEMQTNIRRYEVFKDCTLTNEQLKVYMIVLFLVF